MVLLDLDWQGCPEQAGSPSHRGLGVGGPLDSAELYDPIQIRSVRPAVWQQRAQRASTLLFDGNGALWPWRNAAHGWLVLVAGGYEGGPTTELFDPH